MNKLEIEVDVLETTPLRYTPAGIPLLRLSLGHYSEQLEAQMSRSVECVFNAVILGGLALQALNSGERIIATGFLAKRSLKSKQLILHIQTYRRL